MAVSFARSSLIVYIWDGTWAWFPSTIFSAHGAVFESTLLLVSVPMYWGKMKTAPGWGGRGKKQWKDEVTLIKLVTQVILVLMKSLLGARDCAVYSTNDNLFKTHQQFCEGYNQFILRWRKLRLREVKPPNQLVAELGCPPHRPSSGAVPAAVSLNMRLGNTEFSFLMSPSILATGMFGVMFQCVYESAPRAHLSFFCSFVSLSIGNFSEAREVATRPCVSGDNLTAGNCSGFFLGGQVLGREENGIIRKPVACQACPDSTLERDTLEHSSSGLFPLNNFHFQEFCIHICPEFLTRFEFSSHSEVPEVRKLMQQ